jgi:hypothetical protein
MDSFALVPTATWTVIGLHMHVPHDICAVCSLESEVLVAIERVFSAPCRVTSYIRHAERRVQPGMPRMIDALLAHHPRPTPLRRA